MRMIVEWLWQFLPDRCEVQGCSRQGVRGNENFIEGKRVCDYCHAKFYRFPRNAVVSDN